MIVLPRIFEFLTEDFFIEFLIGFLIEFFFLLLFNTLPYKSNKKSLA